MRLRPRFSVPDPSHGWWGVCCWLILLATPGRSLQAEPPVADGGPKTVTVSVVDDRTGQPVSGFTYRIAVVTTDVRRSDEPGPGRTRNRLEESFRSKSHGHASCRSRSAHGVTVTSGEARKSRRHF